MLRRQLPCPFNILCKLLLERTQPPAIKLM
jgi:hypothetical protein